MGAKRSVTEVLLIIFLKIYITENKCSEEREVLKKRTYFKNGQRNQEIKNIPLRTSIYTWILIKAKTQKVIRGSRADIFKTYN